MLFKDMKFKDAVMQVKADEIKLCIMNEFDEHSVKDLDRYMQVLETLKNMEPVDNGEDISIVIDWDVPDFEGEEGFWRVHGYDPSQELFWGIEYSKWSHWLAWKVDGRFIMMNGINKYVALCLWEMTWGGFTEDDVEARVDFILERDSNG